MILVTSHDAEAIANYVRKYSGVRPTVICNLQYPKKNTRGTADQGGVKTRASDPTVPAQQPGERTELLTFVAPINTKHENQVL